MANVMIAKEKDIEAFIRSIPSISQLSLRAHILLIAYHLSNTSKKPEFSLRILKNIFLKARLPFNADKASSVLKELITVDKSPLIQKGKGKYLLSIYGDEEIRVYLKNKPQIETEISALKDLIVKVKDSNQKLFLGEAISCAENRSYRASIIMTWLFVIDHLQEYVIDGKLSEFNNAMTLRTDCKKLTIKTKEDFEDLKESVFIEILCSANIITKAIKKVLHAKLDTRNSCAHPSNIVIKESMVVEFIDSLIENIVLKYQ